MGEEPEVSVESLRISRIVHSDIQYSSVRVQERGYGLHYDFSLFPVVGTHVVVGRIYQLCLELMIHVFAHAEAVFVDARQRQFKEREDFFFDFGTHFGYSETFEHVVGADKGAQA